MGQTYNWSFKQWTAGFKALVICSETFFTTHILTVDFLHLIG